MEVFKAIYPIPTPWAQNGTYPPRQGNDIQILIDEQTAYGEITMAFKKAKKFIYLTISYGETDFLLVPESEETLFGILMSRSNEGVDVRMVVWQPADPTTHDTIPDRPRRKFLGSMRDTVAFKPGGTRQKAINSGIIHRMDISSRCRWIFRRN